jgi:hypothetical protein
MGFFDNILGKDSKIEEKYSKLSRSIEESASKQSHQYKVNITDEPYKIGQMFGIEKKHAEQHTSQYCDMANYILAQYPTELGFFVANCFYVYVPKLGYDPFGKIMVATQMVDEFAGQPMIARFSFIKENPIFYQFMVERNCPERTQKAEEFLKTGILRMGSAKKAKQAFPKAMINSKMKSGVKKKISDMDAELARYITE